MGLRAWWHRRWCRDCREVRPYEVVVLPNDFPLYEPTLFYIKGGPVAWIGCPLAREEACRVTT
jgi:hypothetical protein